jgi:hypothetical protein
MWLWNSVAHPFNWSTKSAVIVMAKYEASNLRVLAPLLLSPFNDGTVLGMKQCNSQDWPTTYILQG